MRIFPWEIIIKVTNGNIDWFLNHCGALVCYFPLCCLILGFLIDNVILKCF